MKFFAIFLFISSCANEEGDLITNKQSLNDEVRVKNGRLLFLNKESLTQIYQKYANASDENLSRFIQPFINEGFYSLRPVVTAENEALIYNYYKNRIIEHNYLKKTSNSKSSARTIYEDQDALDYLDNIEDVIGDDTFAAFLNSNGEIQVGNEVYKYTDVGLFIVDEDRYVVLEDYLGSNEISNNLMYPTSMSSILQINDEFPNEGVTQIDQDLSYFNMQPNSPDTVTTSSVSNYYSPTPGSVILLDPSYNAFFSNLASCNPRSGLFGSLFGENNVCIDRYENRRRVKTKAYNYNYL